MASDRPRFFVDVGSPYAWLAEGIEEVERRARAYGLPPLLAAASTPAVKAALRERTERAIALGVSKTRREHCTSEYP